MKLPPKEKLEQLRKKYNLALILLHGSQVSGQTHKDSDIDIAVLPQAPNPELDILGLNSDLIGIFENNNVDVSNLGKASPLLSYTATQNSILLAGNDDVYDKLLLNAFKGYHDYEPYFKQQHEFVLARTKHYVAS